VAFNAGSLAVPLRAQRQRDRKGDDRDPEERTHRRNVSVARARGNRDCALLRAA